MRLAAILGWGAAVLGCGLAAAVIGCSKKEDPRAPPIGEECADMEFCMMTGGGMPIGVFVPPPAGNDDAGGGGGPGVTVDAAPGTLVGSVDVLSGTDFSFRAPLDTQQVEISAASSGGGRSTTQYNGSDDFMLANVDQAADLWIAVRQTGGTPPLMTTLQHFDSSSGNLASLLIVERDTMDQIATGLSTDVTLDVTKAHAVLLFVDASSTPSSPVAGVSINDATLTGAVIAYDAGPVYSDTAAQTDQLGRALILNMGAEAFPGAPKTISIRHNGLDEDVVIEAARDALTIAVVILN